MLKRTLFILSVVAIFASCHNTLEVNAPYRESVCVYGMLDPDDTAQYIRVQRVFLGEGNAVSIAQIADSAYFKPGDLKVSLQRIKNGVAVSVDQPATSNMEIVLSETYVTLQNGTFNKNQLIYKTNHPVYADSYYRLVVHNNKTNSTFTSKDVGLIGDFSGGLTYSQQNSQLTLSYSFVNIVPSNGGKVVCMYGAPGNSGVCGLKLRFYYTEYPLGFPPQSKFVDVDLGVQYPSSVSGGEAIDLSFIGDGMLSSIVNAIGVATNIDHRTADSVHYILNAAGEDVALYNQINTTTTLSQDKPYFTNIKGGAGIFSSRRDYTIRKRLSGYCIDHFASAHVACPLRFYGQAGGFLQCN